MIDADALSVIMATITLGPPHAAPIAMKVLDSNLTEALLYLTIGHLGSALVFFLLFQLLKPIIDRLKGTLAVLLLKIKGDVKEGSQSLPFEVFSPGRKYFFLGTVAEKIVRHARCPVLTVAGRDENYIDNPDYGKMIAHGCPLQPGPRLSLRYNRESRRRERFL